MIELIYVPPVELQGSWEKVREGLEIVQRRASDGWIPEDVYHALKAGVSTLHLAYQDQEYVGFVILTPMQAYDCKKLMIWCAYNTGESDVVELVVSQLEQMARNIGARKLTFGSPRKWERRLKDFHAVTTYYEKDV